MTLGEGVEDTRRRVRVSELGGGPDMVRVVDAFGAARMLVFDVDPTTREPTIEIAHEALLQAWPRLRGWLDEDRDGLRIHRHLTETTGGWVASGRDDGELYRGGRLETALAWADGHPADLNDDEREFLERSRAAHEAAVDAEREHFEQQARSNRRLRMLVALAEARGTQLENEALQAGGAANVVGLRMAEVLDGTEVIILSTTGPSGVNPLDLDALLRGF